MPLSNAEKQARYRAKRKSGTSEQRLNLYLSADVLVKLRELSNGYGVTIKDTLERIITEEYQKADAAKKKPDTQPVPKKSNKAKKEKAPPRPPINFDAVGLARTATFKDSRTAVGVTVMIKDFPKLDKDGRPRADWRDKPRELMAVWEAKQHIDGFRKTHAEAAINQRYMTEDKSIMEIVATYADDRPAHRVIYQARRN